MTNKTEAPELLPCPFCGGEAAISQKDSNFAQRQGGFRVACRSRFTTCTMNSRTNHCTTKVEAAEAWNTRADPSDAKDKRIFALDGNREALEAEITDIHETYKATLAELEAKLAKVAALAASTGYRVCAETHHVTLGMRVEKEILAELKGATNEQ